MGADRTTQLQAYIARLQQGDEAAREELIEAACDRLRFKIGRRDNGPAIETQTIYSLQALQGHFVNIYMCGKPGGAETFVEPGRAEVGDRGHEDHDLGQQDEQHRQGEQFAGQSKAAEGPCHPLTQRRPPVGEEASGW